MTHIDLSPGSDPADLIDAIFQVRRDNRLDLRAQISRLMSHEDRIVREEAMSLLTVKWKLSDFHERVRDMVLRDSDEGVRARATLGFALTSNKESRAGDAQLLANIYYDKQSSASLRNSAYTALTVLAGQPKWVFSPSEGDADQVERLVQSVLEAEHQGGKKVVGIDVTRWDDVPYLVAAINRVQEEGRRDCRPEIELLLGHFSPLVRADAISLLTSEWRIKEYRQTISDLISRDPDFLVRLHAVLGLGWISDDETRVEDAELLSDVYRKSTEVAEVRAASFDCLCRLAGRPIQWVTPLDDTDSSQVDDLVIEIRALGHG